MKKRNKKYAKMTNFTVLHTKKQMAHFKYTLGCKANEKHEFENSNVGKCYHKF